MPTTKRREYELTADVLQNYRSAAVLNARELAQEAALLLHHKHYARAYFLAVAAIEETGKAVMAFEGSGRDLSNPAVIARLKTQFEDHRKKISSAFMPWIVSTPNIRDEVMGFVRTMVDVRFGREPSMYVDIHVERGVHTPAEVIPTTASEHCVRLAATVLRIAESHFASKQPTKTTKEQDEFFTMKNSDYVAISNLEDFWWYYIERMEAGERTLEGAVLGYYRHYYLRDKKYTPKHSE